MSLQTPLNNTVYGTILPGGTLSSEFNIQGYSLYGVQFLSASVNGTLGFMVSDKPDAQGGVYRPLYTALGVPVAVTAPSGVGAISGDAFSSLRPFQYIRVSSTAQTLGLALMFNLKTE